MPDEMSKLLSKRLATCEDPETRAFLQILLLGNEQVAQGEVKPLRAIIERLRASKSTPLSNRR
jgi:hypothetical protein